MNAGRESYVTSNNTDDKSVDMGKYARERFNKVNDEYAMNQALNNDDILLSLDTGDKKAAELFHSAHGNSKTRSNAAGLANLPN